MPLVGLHVPEFPVDEEPGFPERVLEELGVPVGTAGIHYHRDARTWAEWIEMRYWPTFLAVDRDRKATFVLIGWAGEDKAYRDFLAELRRLRG